MSPVVLVATTFEFEKGMWLDPSNQHAKISKPNQTNKIHGNNYITIFKNVSCIQVLPSQHMSPFWSLPSYYIHGRRTCFHPSTLIYPMHISKSICNSCMNTNASICLNTSTSHGQNKLEYPTSSHILTHLIPPPSPHVSHVSFSSSVFSLLRFSRCTSTALLPLGFLAGGAVEVEGTSSSVSFLFFLELMDIGPQGIMGFQR